MSRNSWFSSLFTRFQFIRSRGSVLCNRQSRLAFEPIELRTLLTTLSVDIADPACGDAGNNRYCEIQEAVDAASEGDKIKVHAGTYNPFVVNTNNLTIREARRNSNPVVDGDLNAGDENGVEINASGVTIRGLTVQNASGTFFSEGPGFLVRGSNNTLVGNTANENNRSGFFLTDSEGNTLKGNRARDNEVNGFSIRFNSDGNTLAGNTARDNELEGFFLSISRGNTLIGNRAIGNGGHGFHVHNSDNNTLTYNRAFHNEGNGYALVNGNNGNLLKHNKARHNDGWGFLVDAVLANMFDDNHCHANGLGGSNQPGIC